MSVWDFVQRVCLLHSMLAHRVMNSRPFICSNYIPSQSAASRRSSNEEMRPMLRHNILQGTKPFDLPAELPTTDACGSCLDDLPKQITTWAVGTPTKEPGDRSARSGHRSCPTWRATTGRPQRQLKPRSVGAFLLPAPTERHVPPMREAAVDVSAASEVAASVALAEAWQIHSQLWAPRLAA
jgi:hypothetical protein